LSIRVHARIGDPNGSDQKKRDRAHQQVDERNHVDFRVGSFFTATLAADIYATHAVPPASLELASMLVGNVFCVPGSCESPRTEGEGAFHSTTIRRWKFPKKLIRAKECW
jgi:hypothetical protein